jgi:hypothetical protein
MSVARSKLASMPRSAWIALANAADCDARRTVEVERDDLEEEA